MTTRDGSSPHDSDTTAVDHIPRMVNRHISDSINHSRASMGTSEATTSHTSTPAAVPAVPGAFGHSPAPNAVAMSIGTRGTGFSPGRLCEFIY